MVVIMDDDDEEQHQSVDEVMGDMIAIWDDSEEQKNVSHEEKEEYQDWIPQPPNDIDLTLF